MVAQSSGQWVKHYTDHAVQVIECVLGERKMLRPTSQRKSGMLYFMPASLTSKMSPAEFSYVKSLSSFWPVWANRQSTFSLCTWETAFELLSTYVIPTWKLIFVLHGLKSWGQFSFYLNFLQVSKGRKERVELSWALLWNHNWAVRVAQLRKGEKRQEEWKNKSAEQHILAFPLFSLLWRRQIMYPRKRFCHCW